MSEFINTETGEIVSSADPPRRKGRQASTRKEVGIETKYPDDCITEDSLLDTLRNIDAYVHMKPSVDYAYLTESLTGKFLTVNEVATLQLIGVSLTGWNYWIGNIQDFHAVLPAAHVARTLRGLTLKNTIRVLHRDKPWRGCMVIKINPVIAFRGGVWFRDNLAIARWYST
ncbi:hypothetical protein D3C85_1257600 [compost metagenome]